MPVIIDTGVDNAGLRAGLIQAESMVDAAVKRISVKMNAAGQITGASMVFAPAVTQQLEKNVGLMGLAATRMQKLQSVGSGLNSVMGRMTGIFSSGLGISAAIGGLALLGTAFSKAIKMAEQFQTAQISIGAILLSTYKVKTPGGQEAGGAQGYMYAHEQSLKYNKQIIERSRKNILTYEEQLKAFQVGLAAGGRKGINPEKVMDISEQIAVGAKAIGLRGERIGEQVRILLGGGVNVQRSMFAKILGITSKDISSRSGDELVGFIKSRMKGFETKGVKDEFENSIEAIITTMTSQIDVFLATVGTKVMKKLTPTLKGFGDFLTGPDAAKLGDTLATGFGNVFVAIEKLAKSPAIPLIGKFVTFLANEADKIIIGAVLLRLVGILVGVGTGIANTIGWFNKLGLSAAVAAKEVNGLAVANAEAAMTGGRGVGGFGLKSAEGAAVAAARIPGVLTAAQQATVANMALGSGRGMGPAAAAKLESRLLARSAAALNPAVIEDAALLAGAGGMSVLGRVGGAAGRAVAGGRALAGRAGSWLSGRGVPTTVSKIGSRAIGGALGYGGIKLGADMVGMGDYDKPSGVWTDTLARGVAGGMIAGPWGAVAGVGSELLTLGSQKLGSDAQRAATDKETAAAIAKRPEGTKVKELERQLARAKRMMGEAAGGVAEGGDYLGKTPAQWHAEVPRLEAEIAATTKRGEARYAAEQQTAFEKDPKNKGLNFVSDTERNDMAKAIAQSQSTATQVGEGTGPLRQKQKVYWEFHTKALTLRKSIAEGDIKLVDADLIAKNAEIEQQRKSLDNADSANFNPAQQKRLRAFNQQQEDLGRRQGERYIADARGQKDRNLADIDRQKKEMLESGGVETLQTQYQKGRKAIESQTRTDSAILGVDTGAVLKKRLADFDTVFDMRGKKIVEQIAGLGLGVGSENVVQATKLAFDKAMADIDQALATHVITQAEALKMRAQQKQKNIADQLTNAYNEPRRLGLVDSARSEIAQKSAATRATLAGASGYNPLTEEANKGVGAIESERAKGMLPAEFSKYKSDAADKLRRDIVAHADDVQQQYREAQANREQTGLQRAKEREERPIQNAMAGMQLGEARTQVGQAQFGAEQARYQGAMYEAGLNPANARMMDRAQKIVGREQGRISLGDAEALVREGISIQRRSNAAAILKADSDIKTAQLNLQMAETQAKYLPALQASTIALQDMAWSKLNKDVNAMGVALTNGAGDFAGAMGAINKANKGLAPGKGEAVPGEKTEGGGPSFQIDVGPGFTEKDVDVWIPKIREKLCKLAGNSGSRG